jgi:DNA-binding XRE family transcriptional regulator
MASTSYEQGYEQPPTATLLFVLRHVRRLTQKGLGELAGGLSQETISRIETGVQVPRLETCIRLARALDIPADVLFPKQDGER